MIRRITQRWARPIAIGLLAIILPGLVSYFLMLQPLGQPLALSVAGAPGGSIRGARLLRSRLGGADLLEFAVDRSGQERPLTIALPAGTVSPGRTVDALTGTRINGAEPLPVRGSVSPDGSYRLALTAPTFVPAVPAAGLPRHRPTLVSVQFRSSGPDAVSLLALLALGSAGVLAEIILRRRGRPPIGQGLVVVAGGIGLALANLAGQPPEYTTRYPGALLAYGVVLGLVTSRAPPLGATVAGLVAGAALSLVDPADAAWLLLLWPVTGLVTDGAMAVAGRSRLALIAAVTAGVSAATYSMTCSPSGYRLSRRAHSRSSPSTARR